jgi:hypothetical protein
MMKREKRNFHKRFKMHDLEEARYLLAVEIIRDRKKRKLWLSQASYIQSILERHGMSECKSVGTPQEPGTRLVENEGESVKVREYQALVGALTYTALATRPDIAAPLNFVAQIRLKPWRRALESCEENSEVPQRYYQSRTYDL